MSELDLNASISETGLTWNFRDRQFPMTKVGERLYRVTEEGDAPVRLWLTDVDHTGSQVEVWGPIGGWFWREITLEIGAC